MRGNWYSANIFWTRGNEVSFSPFCADVFYRRLSIVRQLKIWFVLLPRLGLFLNFEQKWFWWCYPTPSEGWGRGETPRRPNSRTTPQGLDQKSKMEKVEPKMARLRGSDAGQSRRRWVKSCRFRLSCQTARSYYQTGPLRGGTKGHRTRRQINQTCHFVFVKLQ